MYDEIIWPLYLGVYSVAPVTRIDGSPLQEHDVFLRSTDRRAYNFVDGKWKCADIKRQEILITEQHLREIAGSILRYSGLAPEADIKIKGWLKLFGQELLDKLNGESK